MSRKTRGLEPGKGSKPSSARKQAKEVISAARDAVSVIDVHDKQIIELQQYVGMIYGAMDDVVRGSEELDVNVMAVIAVLAKKLGVTSDELEHERAHIRKLKAAQRAKHEEELKKAQESAGEEPPLPDLLSQRTPSPSVSPSSEYPGAFEFGG